MHKVHTPIGGRKDGRTDRRTDGRNDGKPKTMSLRFSLKRRGTIRTKDGMYSKKKHHLKVLFKEMQFVAFFIYHMGKTRMQVKMI